MQYPSHLDKLAIEARISQLLERIDAILATADAEVAEAVRTGQPVRRIRVYDSTSMTAK